jgi:hypothetical protein
MTKPVFKAAFAAAAALGSSLAVARDMELKIQTAPGVEIAGTLSLPQTGRSGGKSPLVILISGSGPQNRDASNIVEGYAPHAEWARHFERQGIATFRYDERGVGQSGGNWAAMTITEHAGDVGRIVAELGRRSDLDPARIVVAGHSEGSMITSMLVANKVPIAGAVPLAGPSWTMDRVVDHQALQNVKRGNMSDEEFRAAVAELKRDFLAKVAQVPNMRSTMDLKPLELAARIDVPVLIVQGGSDIQVPPEQAGELADAIIKSGNKDVSLRVFPGINHLLLDQPADIDSYDQLPVKSLAEPVIDVVISWLASRFSLAGGAR